MDGIKWRISVTTQADGKDYVGIDECGDEQEPGFAGLHASEGEAEAVAVKYAQEQGLPLFADYQYPDTEKASAPTPA